MTPSLPIPTDNIYKFSCLFGLTLIVVSIFSFATVYSSILDKKVKHMEVIIPLEAKADRRKTDDKLIELNRQLIEVSKDNERMATKVVGGAIGLALILSAFGGYNWYYKIQKRDDKLAQLQIEKLEAEVAKLRNELTTSNPSSSDSDA